MKKFSALLICLLMIVTCSFAGCATFSVDKVKYYNEVLATVDETKITRFDLLNAYNSYGNSYYVQQMGQSEEEALNSTLDLLIDRELMYQYALDHDNLYRPTAYQINQTINEMFDSIDNQMNSYVQKAKTIFKIETEEVEKEEDKNETAYKFSDYTYKPRAEVKSEVKEKTVYYTDNTFTTKTTEETEFSLVEEYNHYFIEYIIPEEDETYEKVIDEEYLKNFSSSKTLNQIKTKYFEQFKNELTINEKENANLLYNKAISMFANDLIDYEYYLRDENGKKLDKTNEGLFSRYFQRTFEDQIKSQYLENVRTYYLAHEELNLELIEKEYLYLENLSYNTYSDNHSAYKDKMKNISTKGDDILYHPTTDAQFGYFIHTLISFDSIKDNLKNLENEKDEAKRQERYEQYVSSIKVKARDLETGLVPEDAEELTLQQVIAEYNQIKTYATDAERMSAFIQFMFKYTGDTATLSQGMPYVVGTNGYSSMVEEFNDEAILLMTGKDKEGNKIIEGKAGNMSSTNIHDLDSLCITDYGIHLLYYIGDVNSFDIPYGADVYIQNDYIEDDEMFNLYTKTINPLTKETYFDKIFDIVYPAGSGEVYSSKNGYADYEKSITEASKNDHPVTKYTTKIKATKLDI